MVIKLLMARIEQERAAQELVKQNTAQQQYHVSYDKVDRAQLFMWTLALSDVINTKPTTTAIIQKARPSSTKNPWYRPENTVFSPPGGMFAD